MSILYSILKNAARATARSHSRSNIWETTIRHDELNKYRIIRGKDKYVVEQKAAVQLAAWEEIWQRKLEKEQKLKGKQSKTESAIEQTKEATKAIMEIENILRHTLNIDNTIDWETLKDKAKFPKVKPQLPPRLAIPQPPEETDLQYQPKFGLFDKISSSRKQNKIASAKLLFKTDYDKWMEEKEKILKNNAELEKQYQEGLKQLEADEQEFLKQQQEKFKSH